MMRPSAKCFLATICFIALTFILGRFAFLYHGTLSTKLKVYRFYIGEQKLRIRQDGSNTETVEWSTASGKLRSPASENEQTRRKSSEKSVLEPVATILPVVKRVLTESPIKSWSKSSEVFPYLPSKDAPSNTSMLSTQAVKATIDKNTTTQVNEEGTTETLSVSSTVKSGGLELCSQEGENLVGPLAVDQSVPSTEADIDEVWDEKGWVEKGGAWRPTKCQAVSKVAIIIPYRNRPEHLKIFLRHMHPMLKRQLLDYRILVIEQAGDTPFNRAMLFNIGFKESLKFHDFECFVFHDVDLIPEDDRNYYGCPTAPRHLSVAIDKFRYKLPYAGIFGGAGAFRKDDFKKINGFSNRFWGWGGEDDDLYKRITAKGFKLSRPSMITGRYKMVRIFHKSAKADPKRFEKLRNSQQRMVSDGLSSLNYNVEKTVEYSLYTMVTVAVDPDEV